MHKRVKKIAIATASVGVMVAVAAAPITSSVFQQTGYVAASAAEEIKKGYNQAILNYQAPKWFKSILVIGCLAWVVFIFIWFRKKDKFKSVLK